MGPERPRAQLIGPEWHRVQFVALEQTRPKLSMAPSSPASNLVMGPERPRGPRGSEQHRVQAELGRAKQVEPS